MTPRQRELVLLSAAVAAGDAGALRLHLARAAEAADGEAVEETLLQSYLFVGYPAALRALGEWRRVQAEHGETASGAGVEEPDWAAWQERGRETCRRVYAGQYDRLRDNVRRLHPAMEQWMVAEGYGKVLGRPGLELATRELCIVALLAGQDAAPQLYSHLRGALNAGATEADVDEVVALLSPGLSPARRDVLMMQWKAVQQRRTPEN